MNWIEITGAISGFIYVVLEIRQKRAMWIVGALSALMYIIVFFSSSLHAAALLQIYYLIVSVYGWKRWGGGGDSSDNSGMNLNVTVKLPFKRAVYSIIAAFVGFIFVQYLLSNFSEDPYPYLDSFVAVLSMLATWWVSGKYIENWILWIIADLAAAILFFWQGLYATAILYVVYMIAAVVGFLHWRKFPVKLK
ncbi:MAG: nicotinamide riboside transporter PnuC [Bacteroidales bacterium]|jgi:nicotinamide mononucleotide transporter|nr:nicotinamide riboside transporter PnuC [Bacteroidales bacterium]MDD4057449.1 nicotinamide riboside transporter PnuC [Bacteroidales bacterium]